MAAIALSTAGIEFAYAVETTAGTKPSAFTIIPRAMSIPSINPTPNNIDVTPLSETQYKSYISGLQDVGGSLAIKFSLTNDFKTIWTNLCAAAKAAAAETPAKSTWFEAYIPGMTDAFYFKGEPTELGFGGAEVDSHLEIDAYVAPTEITGWDTAIKPTAAA